MTNPADVEISKGIVVNPHRCGGEPCVEGTRIPAEMVAKLLDVDGEDGMHPDDILDDYPSLTYRDLTNVRLWARRNRNPFELANDLMARHVAAGRIAGRPRAESHR